MACPRCGVEHVDDLMTCVGNLMDQREQGDKAAMLYLADLHFALRYAVAIEWLYDECPACGGSRPDHFKGCFVAGFLEGSGARHLTPTGVQVVRFNS